MAGRGPVPKRLEERRRGDRSRTGVSLAQVVTVPGEVQVSSGDPAWHPVPAALYESLFSSGMVEFYEPSDYAIAYLLCQQLSDGMLSLKGLSSSTLATCLQGFSDLGMTEGARRRARIELMKPDADDGVEDPVLKAMAQYRNAAA